MGEQIYLRDSVDMQCISAICDISGMILSYQTTRMGFEPTTSAVTGRRSNQLSHQAKLLFYLMFYS